MDLFDNSIWSYATADTLRCEKIYPNKAGYCEDRQTLAVIVKRSSGFALMEAGLSYLLESLARGESRNGKPVKEAIVVLADVDFLSIRPTYICTAREMKSRVDSKTPLPSMFGSGRYWWVDPENVDDFKM
jgi:hypothetical protein